MVTTLKNVIVVGGSYVGQNAAQQLAGVLPVTHRVLLIEPHSHFHHLFVFPRYSVVPKHEHMAFIPFTGVFANSPNRSLHEVVRAKVVSVHKDRVILDRSWQGSTEVPFDYITIATGTTLSPPGTMPTEDKKPAVEYFQKYQAQVARAESIVILGGGAVGVQMATDLKELYPSKSVTLVQSRDRVMPKFHAKFHELIKERFEELGVKLVTNNGRVTPPAAGFPTDGSTFTITLKDGTTLPTQLVIPATGQTANNQLLASLPQTSPNSLVNPENGFIRVSPTLQFQDPLYPNFYAVGDIADTGAHKAARPGMAQAEAVARNIAAGIEGREPVSRIKIAPAGIHLTLGIRKNIVFRNPPEGETEPSFTWRDDGEEDMGIKGVWERRGVRVNGADEYHL